MNGEWIDIVAPSREHAERLAAAIGDDFDVSVRGEDRFTVRVTPDSETAAKLVALFNSVGQWLTEGGLSSCAVEFGESSLTVLPASADHPGDPTTFLLERTRQLELALTSRIVIEQAKGILAERRGIGVDEAFEVLRATARGSRRNIHDVSAEVVSGEARP